MSDESSAPRHPLIDDEAVEAESDDEEEPINVDTDEDHMDSDN